MPVTNSGSEVTVAIRIKPIHVLPQSALLGNDVAVAAKLCPAIDNGRCADYEGGPKEHYGLPLCSLTTPNRLRQHDSIKHDGLLRFVHVN
jgi:hypothetical protein